MRAALFAYAKKERFEFTYKEAAEELKKQGFQTSHGAVYNEINTKGKGWRLVAKNPLPLLTPVRCRLFPSPPPHIAFVSRFSLLDQE